MERITEIEINSTMEAFESLSEDEMATMVEQFSTEQTDIVNYVMSDEIALFSATERQIMLYLGLVIWKTIDMKEFTGVSAIPLNIITTSEDYNWELLDTQDQDAPFLERISVLYEEYPQEDLLAFAEDTLAESEGAFNREAREPMFVMLKSIIDSFSMMLAV